MEEIRQWVNTVSGMGSAVAVAVGILYTLRELRRKTKAETRLTESSKVESDIKLLTLFPKLMSIAHGRGDVVYSKELTDYLLSSQANKAKFENMEGAQFRGYFTDRSIITAAVGKAEQDAAICAIAQLGEEHEVLRPIALQGLESLLTCGIEAARPHLESLKRHAPN